MPLSPPQHCDNQKVKPLRTRDDILEAVLKHDVHQLVPTEPRRVDLLPIGRYNVEIRLLLFDFLRHRSFMRWGDIKRVPVGDLAVLGGVRVGGWGV